MTTRLMNAFFAALPAMIVCGCLGSSSGPELVDVSGTVTMDGKPLPNAIVTFRPEGAQGGEQSRPAYGQTDDDGRYRLQYSTEKSGAIPGKYSVSISTYRRPDEDKDGNEIPGAAETVPEVYNAKTTLTAEVSADQPAHDFELKSDAGPIAQATVEP